MLPTMGGFFTSNLTPAEGQPIGAVPFQKAEIAKADDIATDTEGNLYVLQDASLKKFSGNGELLYSYSDFQAGTNSTHKVMAKYYYVDGPRGEKKSIMLDRSLIEVETNL